MIASADGTEASSKAEPFRSTRAKEWRIGGGDGEEDSPAAVTPYPGGLLLRIFEDIDRLNKILALLSGADR